MSKTCAAPPTALVGRYHALSVSFCINHTLFLNNEMLLKVVVVTPVIAIVEMPVMLAHVELSYSNGASTPFTQ